MQKCRLNGIGCIKTSHDIDQCDTDLQRSASRLIIWNARDAHQTAHCLNQQVVSWLVGIGARVAKACYGAIDKTGVDKSERGGIQSVLFQRTRLEVFDEDVA